MMRYRSPFSKGESGSTHVLALISDDSRPQKNSERNGPKKKESGRNLARATVHIA